ncbi:MAG TPA: hypothetical protein PK135_12470, partial [Arenimonas sp.]|nr:hypothetical protein [Arenimonas sp.]
MNWLIGFIALLVGAALSQERWLLGGTLGFFIGWLLSSMSQLRSRLDGFEAELMQARDAFRKMAAERDQLSARLKGINPAAPVAPETIKPEPQKPVPPPIPVPTPSVVPADTRKPAGPNIP